MIGFTARNPPATDLVGCGRIFGSEWNKGQFHKKVTIDGASSQVCFPPHLANPPPEIDQRLRVYRPRSIFSKISVLDASNGLLIKGR